MSENSVDPDQMLRLIWVYTVCWNLSVPILRGFAIPYCLYGGGFGAVDFCLFALFVFLAGFPSQI